MQPTNSPDDVQKLDGPDYVTVVVEFTEDEAPTTVRGRPLRDGAPRNMLATVLGALGAIALTSWALHALEPS